MSGAELPLAIAGVALAWRGIVDVVDVLITLCRDDDQDRDFVRMRTEVAYNWFIDWGKFHGLEAKDGGTLGRLTPKNRATVKEIMDVFEKKTKEVLATLERYADGAANRGGGGRRKDSSGGAAAPGMDREVFRRTALQMKLRVKKGWKKVPWNMKDRDAVKEYFKTVMEAKEMLEQATYFETIRQISRGAVNSIATPSKPDGTLGGAEQSQLLLPQKGDLPKSQGLGSAVKPADSILLPSDEDIIARVANSVRSINDVHMTNLVQYLATQAHYIDIDDHLCNQLHDFWQMPPSHAKIVKIETAWDPRDTTNNLCAAALYSCASQPKLIYLWDEEGGANRSPEKALAQLVYSLLKQCLAGEFWGGSSHMPAVEGFDGARVRVDDDSVESLEAAIELIGLLLAKAGTKPMLTTLSGLEHLPNEGTHGDLSRALIKTVCSTYKLRKDGKLDTRTLFLTQSRGQVLGDFDIDLDWWETILMDASGDPSRRTKNLLSAVGISVEESQERVQSQ